MPDYPLAPPMSYSERLRRAAEWALTPLSYGPPNGVPVAPYQAEGDPQEQVSVNVTPIAYGNQPPDVTRKNYADPVPYQPITSSSMMPTLISAGRGLLSGLAKSAYEVIREPDFPALPKPVEEMSQDEIRAHMSTPQFQTALQARLIGYGQMAAGLNFMGKNKQWLVNKLEKPEAGEKFVSSLTADVETALDRLNRNMKREPGVGQPTKPSTMIQNAGTGESLIVGKITPEEWVNDRIGSYRDPTALKNDREWYDNLYGLFVQHFGKKEAIRELKNWLLSQQQTSPSGGMMNVLRAHDIASGFPQIKQAGLSQDAIIASIKGEKITEGVGQKLSDFFDAGLGKLRRSYYRNDPRAGSPAPFDVWAARDAGFIDDEMIRLMEAKYGKGSALGLTADIQGGPSETQYEWGSKFYNELTDYLNKNKIAGGAWTPAQAQAVGWMQIQRKLGKTPETPEMIFTKNYRSIPTELSPGENSPLAMAFPSHYTLAGDASEKITKHVLDKAIPEIAALNRVEIVNAPYSRGGYTSIDEAAKTYKVENPSPIRSIQVMGSPEGVDSFSASLGLALNQEKMIHTRPLASGKNSAIEFRTADGSPLSKADTIKVGHYLQMNSPTKGAAGAELPTIRGYTPLPEGSGLVVFKDKGHFSAADSENILVLLNDINEKYNINLKGKVFHADVRAFENKWAQNPSGDQFKAVLRSTGRSDILPALDDTHRRVFRWTEEAFEKHAPENLKQFRLDNPTAHTSLTYGTPIGKGVSSDVPITGFSQLTGNNKQ